MVPFNPVLQVSAIAAALGVSRADIRMAREDELVRIGESSALPHRLQ